MFNEIVSNIIRKLISLFRLKSVYIIIALISIVIFSISMLRQNTLLQSLLNTFGGSILTAIILIVMWIVIISMIEPLLPLQTKTEPKNEKSNADILDEINNAEDSLNTVTNTDESQHTSITEPSSKSEIAMADDDIEHVLKQNVEPTAPPTINQNKDDNISYNINELDENSIQENNEKKEVDNSSKLLYHKDSSGFSNEKSYDGDSIDSIIYSNNKKEAATESSFDLDELVESSKNSDKDSLVGNLAGNFVDFGSPQLAAQAIRTMRAKDKGNS